MPSAAPRFFASALAAEITPLSQALSASPMRALIAATVTAGVARMSVFDVVKAALPFVAILFVFLILVTYVPFISTWLPTLLMGPEIVT